MPSMPPNHRTPRANLLEQRGSASSRGYDARWRALRLDYLMRHPLCRMCEQSGRLTSATCVDHIVSIVKGGGDDDDNLQPLCHACHNRKGNQSDGVGFGGRGRGG